MSCSFEGCDRPARTRTWCYFHYRQWKETGILEPWAPLPKVERLCSAEDCDRPHWARTWCALHYRRWKKTGMLELRPPPPKVERLCSVVDCGRRHFGHGYCRKHRYRVVTHGSPDYPRTRSVCSMSDCDKYVTGHGLCGTHYSRLRRCGDPAKTWNGPDNHGWRGDDITYRAAHKRVRNALGRAGDHDCVDCGQRGREWSYDHDDVNEKADDRGLFYSASVDHYEPRCKRCHVIFDKQWVSIRRRSLA